MVDAKSPGKLGPSKANSINYSATLNWILDFFFQIYKLTAGIVCKFCMTSCIVHPVIPQLLVSVCETLANRKWTLHLESLNFESTTNSLIKIVIS